MRDEDARKAKVEGMNKMKEAKDIIVEIIMQTCCAIQAEKHILSHQLMMMTKKHQATIKKTREDAGIVIDSKEASAALMVTKHNAELKRTNSITADKCKVSALKKITNPSKQLTSRDEKIGDLRKIV